MSTPNRPNLTEGGQRTHAAFMASAPPDLSAVLGRHEQVLSNHDARISALEAGAAGEDYQGDEVS